MIEAVGTQTQAWLMRAGLTVGEGPLCVQAYEVRSLNGYEASGDFKALYRTLEAIRDRIREEHQWQADQARKARQDLIEQGVPGGLSRDERHLLRTLAMAMRLGQARDGAAVKKVMVAWTYPGEHGWGLFLQGYLELGIGDRYGREGWVQMAVGYLVRQTPLLDLYLKAGGIVGFLAALPDARPSKMFIRECIGSDWAELGWKDLYDR